MYLSLFFKKINYYYRGAVPRSGRGPQIIFMSYLDHSKRLFTAYDNVSTVIDKNNFKCEHCPSLFCSCHNSKYCLHVSLRQSTFLNVLFLIFCLSC